MLVMQQYQPLHADRHRSAFNLTLVLAIGVAVVGLITEEFTLVLIGLTVGAFSWFTTPAQYLIFEDHLDIAYGRPRVRHVSFRRVEQVDLIQFPLGTRVRVSLRVGRPLLIQPMDGQEFQSRFQGALESYRLAHPDDYGEQQEGSDPTA